MLDLPHAATVAETNLSSVSLLTRMAILSKVAARLTRCSNLDELCREAIVLGRQQLGFDRLGLWFTSNDPKVIIGSYGTDETGALRDERGQRMNLSDDYSLNQAIYRKERYAYTTNITLTSRTGQPLQQGWKATAALWDGEEIIGYLFTDNLLRGMPYTEDDGELLALYALLLGHLCTRQRIEEELRKREARYRALIDAIPDSLAVVDRSGLILDWHAMQPSDAMPFPLHLQNRTLTELLPLPLVERYQQAITEVLASDQALTLDHPLEIGNHFYYLETRLRAIDSDKVVALVRDVTARKQLEEQLYASQKMESLGRMASGIAHDFNNLLTVIQGFASIAELQAATGTEKLRTALAQIKLASEKGSHLTNQLLLFARKQVAQPLIVDVNTLIDGMTTLLNSLVGDEIELRIESDAHVGFVQIEPSQFEQVIVNLAVNARDAMPTGGYLTIRTTNHVSDESDIRQRLPKLVGQYVLVEISDTGVGIAEALLTQIFDPFFTTKERGKGTGLGLAICQSIIQQSGGQLRVQSIPKQGTTFQIFLPCAQQQPTPVLAANLPAPVAGVETILLVEDDEPVRMVAAEMLASHGYTVLDCGAGVDAVRMARDYPQPINLLMTDMMMPQMNGREVAEQFMQLRPGIPVLLVSGYMAELPEVLVQCANVTFLPKPYSLPVLTKTVRKILDQRLSLP